MKKQQEQYEQYLRHKYKQLNLINRQTARRAEFYTRLLRACQKVYERVQNRRKKKLSK